MGYGREFKLKSILFSFPFLLMMIFSCFITVVGGGGGGRCVAGGRCLLTTTTNCRLDWLIVGLGNRNNNSNSSFSKTRHNIGMEFIDYLLSCSSSVDRSSYSSSCFNTTSNSNSKDSSTFTTTTTTRTRTTTTTQLHQQQISSNFADLFLVSITQNNHVNSSLLLAKPNSWINQSGHSVLGLSNAFNPSRILIVHDCVELPFGRVKWKQGGSSLGHNGVKSIIQQLGTKVSFI